MPVPVLGDEADPGLPDLPDVPLGDVHLVEGDDPGGGLAHTHHHLDELGLAVALDPGDADDLAGVDGQRDVVEDPAAAGAPSRPTWSMVSTARSVTE